MTSQVTAVTAPASLLRPIDVSHVHPGGQSSVSSSVGPLQVPGRHQPGHARPAGTSPMLAGSTQLSCSGGMRAAAVFVERLDAGCDGSPSSDRPAVPTTRPRIGT